MSTKRTSRNLRTSLKLFVVAVVGVGLIAVAVLDRPVDVQQAAQSACATHDGVSAVSGDPETERSFSPGYMVTCKDGYVLKVR